MSKIKSIVKKKIEKETLWNLAVEGDESYIANGFVVHNCRSVLIPITKYQDYEIDSVTNSGKNIDKFLDKELEKSGFSRFSNKTEAKKELIDERPVVTDPGVELVCKSIDDLTEEYHYSLDGVLFQKTIIKYENKNKKKIVSVKHDRTV